MWLLAFATLLTSCPQINGARLVKKHRERLGQTLASQSLISRIDDAFSTQAVSTKDILDAAAKGTACLASISGSSSRLYKEELKICGRTFLKGAVDVLGLTNPLLGATFKIVFQLGTQNENDGLVKDLLEQVDLMIKDSLKELFKSDSQTRLENIRDDLASWGAADTDDGRKQRASTAVAGMRRAARFLFDSNCFNNVNSQACIEFHTNGKGNSQSLLYELQYMQMATDFAAEIGDGDSDCDFKDLVDRLVQAAPILSAHARRWYEFRTDIDGPAGLSKPSARKDNTCKGGWKCITTTQMKDKWMNTTFGLSGTYDKCKLKDGKSKCNGKRSALFQNQTDKRNERMREIEDECEFFIEQADGISGAVNNLNRIARKRKC